ncbi:hypothetical protein ABE237_29145 [Brevibacillus formosus]|uniref:Uncharacterized protein n=2 Tax=Brevibacillus TaxID=55080 RepID=C0ZIQ0_BREBN|nr:MULTISPECIES: hypothetical protein [Bacillales]MED1948695.1 hypothetical protein [Brevibacillus formosus]MED1958561.1 hypothetical protein [Brevibacillus formosus]MED2000394.1 hypothetical protein [Brevibacillus formosus]MED2085584.1 hypothetical protein [Brevibacillus formosus]BAH41268.1 hypothetical protein BBR47_02910 [Brevibacillus brevis NBRC 100599]
MWKTIVSNLPAWPVFIQAAVVFLVPYAISRLFHWIRTTEEE